MSTKSVFAAVLDAALNYIKTNGDRICLCSQPPTSFAEATSTYELADIDIDSDDYTGPANGDVGGRKITVNAQTGIAGDVTGYCTHIAVVDTSGENVVYVTTIPNYRTNTAQAGGASTITLDANASAVDDAYNSLSIRILSGTGSGQEKPITDYDGTTKVATVASAWSVNPDNTSVFEIYIPLLTGGSINMSAWDIEFGDPV